MLTNLEDLIEEIYGLPIEEFPTQNFRDMGIYVEAVKKGYNKSNWLKFKPKRSYQGFSFGDDLFLQLLIECEKLFNISIKDDEADRINTVKDLKIYVKQI